MSAWVHVVTAIIAFGVSGATGFFLIPYLRKIHFGQTILEIGPRWHKNKQGTPVMGGFLFISGTLLGVAVGFAMLNSSVDGGIAQIEVVKLFAGLGMALGFGFVGFVDDYIKVIKKQNLGLRARQKLIMQFLIAGAYFLTIYLAGDTSTIVRFPFIGQLELGILYFPLAAVVMVFIVNAVNLTDGIDGLCGSVTFLYCVAFMAIATMLQFAALSVYATAMAAACLGFLVWNFHPAKVFMGDVGSMFLGGTVVALGFGTGLPVLIALAGIIYVCEALSVVLQVISFKTTGKRIFKMSPIHHHYEMCGWSEVKIVAVFSLITIAAGGLSIACVLGI